jgi:hypothetical protein
MNLFVRIADSSSNPLRLSAERRTSHAHPATKLMSKNLFHASASAGTAAGSLNLQVHVRHARQTPATPVNKHFSFI